MKFVLVALLLVLSHAVMDAKIKKCLVDCSHQNKAINVCVTECSKNTMVVNGVVKPATTAKTTATTAAKTTAKGATTQKSGTVTKTPVKHEETDLEREIDFLHEKEREDDSETSKLEKELLEEEKKMSADRKLSEEDAKEFINEERAPKKDAAKIKKAHDALIRDQKEMMVEMRKLREERQRLIEVERNAALLKEMEGNLEHPSSDVQTFACLKACLNKLRDAVACKHTCELQARLHVSTTSGKPLETHAPGAKCKGTCYGAQKVKDQCCDTCEDVQAAYMARNWAIPTLDHFVQCKGDAKAIMSHTQIVGGRERLFHRNFSQKQHDTNKAIHSIMFKNLLRHTDTKPHFLGKTDVKPTGMSVEKANAAIKKWEEYRLKKKDNFVPGMIMQMSEANRRRWAMLKVHHWMQPHKAVIMKTQGVKKFVDQKKELQGAMAKKIADATHVVAKTPVIQKAKEELKKFVANGNKRVDPPTKAAAPAAKAAPTAAPVVKAPVKH